VRELLAQQDLAAGFDEIPYVTFAGTRVAWGGNEPYEAPGILNPLGPGRHLDRDAFDAWLSALAGSLGVIIHVSDGPLCAVDDGQGWLLTDAGSSASAPSLIDARGRSAPVSGPRRAWIKFDRLVGVVAWPRPERPVESDAADDAELLIEAVENGWWYSARLPNGVLVATFMTDADLLERGRVRTPQRFWQKAREQAPLTRQRIGNAAPPDLVRVLRADSGYSYPDRGRNWIAVGDAARATDPLAGMGILNALRSAVAAANEIHARLNAGQCALGPTGSPPAASRQLQYLQTRSKYYSREGRWPESTFWARRSALSMEGFECRLHPEAILSTSPSRANAIDLARAESLLPYQQIEALLSFLNTPAPAHHVVSFLRQQVGPLDDGLLIAGLQFLTGCGVLRTDLRSGR
jgi:flavin-dependent dehydrogenase